MSDLINGLPKEMDPIKLALHGALGGKHIQKALKSIRGAAYGLQTSNKRVRRFGGMAANRVPSPGPAAHPAPGTSGRRSPPPGRKSPHRDSRDRKAPFCRKCRQSGHLHRDCP